MKTPPHTGVGTLGVVYMYPLPVFYLAIPSFAVARVRNSKRWKYIIQAPSTGRYFNCVTVRNFAFLPQRTSLTASVSISVQRSNRGPVARRKEANGGDVSHMTGTQNDCTHAPIKQEKQKTRLMSTSLVCIVSPTTAVCRTLLALPTHCHKINVRTHVCTHTRTEQKNKLQ